jgi:hypothetical protein
MKTRFTLLFLLISAVCFAQNFEGTIKWSMTSEITDPKMKAQMEEAQKKMNDPATQAQMKQMQESLNDPKTKAMMDANPQMKAQMENAMKMMQGGDMNSMFPTGFTVKVKNGNTLTAMEGGMMAGTETLYLSDKSQSYMINRTNKTYAVFHHTPDEAGKKHGDVKITKTSETQKILNYNCTKTIVTITEKGTMITQIFWTTTEFKGFDLKGLSKQGTGSNYSMFYENMDGVPLKMEMSTPQAKMVMQVTGIKKESVPASAFEVPTGFTETKLPGY